jgi:hypothetical protein
MEKELNMALQMFRMLNQAADCWSSSGNLPSNRYCGQDARIWRERTALYCVEMSRIVPARFVFFVTTFLT